MSEFKTAVSIQRSIDDVFAYVSDPLNMPQWYSAVQTVDQLSGGEPRAGSTYLVRRQLPGGGAARNEMEIVAHEAPARFTIATTSGPTPLTYRYALSPDAGATLLELHATVELSAIAGLAGPLAVRAVKRGMDANLAALKANLERRMDARGPL
ncbi:MAG: SRPBCC family protein [Solirubrobacteraceae bacterium]